MLLGIVLGIPVLRAMALGAVVLRVMVPDRSLVVPALALALGLVSALALVF